MEDLCQKLPVSDPVRGTLESSQRILKDLKSQIDSTYMKLTEHSDSWKGYKSRCHLYSYLDHLCVMIDQCHGKNVTVSLQIEDYTLCVNTTDYGGVSSGYLSFFI